MPEPFSSATAITPTGSGTFEGLVTPDWSQGRAAFGGLVTGQMLRAAQQLLPSLPLRTVMIDFLAPASPGTVQLAAAILRSVRKAGLFDMACPMSLALWASPCARMIAERFSCSARST